MSDIPEDIMAEAEDLAAELPMRVLTDQASVATVIARALMGHEAALRKERDDARASYANLINIIASIREKSGVGAKPMLGELADAIEARIAAAEQRGVERERESAAMDTARLDFLDSLNAALNARSGTVYGWEMVINHNVNRLMMNFPRGVDLNDSKAHGWRSCRNVIDREMARITAARRAAAIRRGEG